MSARPISPAVAALIRALAQQAAAEHLTRQREAQTGSEAERTNPVPLLPTNTAA